MRNGRLINCGLLLVLGLGFLAGQAIAQDPPQKPTPAAPVKAPTIQAPVPAGKTPQFPVANQQLPNPLPATPAIDPTTTVPPQVPVDLLAQNPPVIVKAEAYAGRPYGLGRVSFHHRPQKGADRHLRRKKNIASADRGAGGQRPVHPALRSLR